MAESAAVLLIQFARTPQPGRVKTRMLPQLSAQQACELHCELLSWTCEQLLNSGAGDVELCVAGSGAHPVFDQCRRLGAVGITQQCGRDLGQRMYHAIRQGLSRYAKVILVGSDCPGIDAGYIRQAVGALDTAPVVLGPATDGGYVLIGATSIEASIFAGINWGSSSVYGQTLEALRMAGLEWQALAPLADIDRPQDLSVWEAIKDGCAGPGSTPARYPGGQ